MNLSEILAFTIRKFLVLNFVWIYVNVVGYQSLGLQDGRVSSQVQIFEDRAQGLRICTCRDERNGSSNYNCSNLGLSSIPEFIPNRTTDLNLAGNKIEIISMDAFCHLRSLKRLTLSSNRISKIHVSAFRCLDRLEFLSLANNPIGVLLDGTVNILKSLKELDLSSAKLTGLPRSLVRDLDSLEILRLSHNPIRRFPRLGYDAVSYVPNLMALYLDYTSIKHFDLSYVSKLKILNLTGNSFKKLNNIHFSSSLRSLHMAKCDMYSLDSKMFLGLSRLKILELSHNKLGVITRNVLRPLTSLEQLYLQNVSIVHFSNVSYDKLLNLRELYLQSNYIMKFPLFLQRNGEPSLPELRTLNMDENSIDTILSSRFHTDKLERLSLRRNRLTHVPANVFTNLPNLRYVSLANNILFGIDPRGFKSDTLEEIDLSQTQTIHLRLISDIFQYTPNLRKLDISRSNVNFATELHNLTNLKILKVNQLGLNDFNDLNLGNSSTVEELDASNNNLQELDTKFFKSLPQLRKLVLARNNIHSINKTSLPNNYWESLEAIDLSDNPFYCDCDLLWFRKWLNTTKVKVEGLKITGAYKCTAPIDYMGTSLMDLIHPTQQECLFPTRSDQVLEILTICILTFYLLTMTGAGLHKYRWHVRYWKYIVTAHTRRQTEFEISLTLPYDAFIAYCQSDSRWVIHELMPHLEQPDKNDEEGLRLCVHQRDWMPGRDIMDNVVSSVQSSRKTVLVVSNAFTRSDWCHVELTLAQSRLFQDERDNLVIILLEALDYSHVNPRLRYEMDRRTYIEWPEDSEVGQELFWLKLRQALERPSLT